VVVRGAQAHLVAIAGPSTAWLQNVREDADVTLRTGRRRRAATARIVEDEQERDLVRRTYVDPVFAFDRVSAVINQRGAPTAERIRAMHRRWSEHGTVVVLDLALEDEIGGAAGSVNR
jgi:hypothetical protein